MYSLSYHEITDHVTDEEEWKKSVQKAVVPIYDTAGLLLSVRKTLASFEGETLATATQQKTPVRPYLVGGITDEGEYRDTGLATLTDRLFGISINTPYQWINAQQQGLKADQYVTIQTTETPFLSLLETVLEATSTVVKIGNEQPDQSLSPDQLLENPQKVVEQVQKFIVDVIDVTANSNHFAFFAHTTRNVTQRYLVEAFPDLENEISAVADFAGLERIYVPDLQGEVREGYTIWGHEDGGLLDGLYGLNQAIWAGLQDDELRSGIAPLFEEVPDLRAEFADQVGEALETVGWSYPDYVDECDHPDKPMDDGTQKIQSIVVSDNLRLTKRTGYAISHSGNHYSLDKELDEPVSLFRYLDDVMPAIFLGRYRLEADIPNNSVRVYPSRSGAK